jgi:soluble lytic murein transglycosylase-like protein
VIGFAYTAGSDRNAAWEDNPLAVAKLTEKEMMSVKEVESVLRHRLKGRKHKAKAARLAKHLVEQCEAYGFSPALVLSLMSTESSFNTRAVSHVGAIGLMQVMPVTAGYISKKRRIREYRTPKDLYNPVINITVGVAYLAYLRAKFRTADHYLAAYNMGPTNVYRDMNRNGEDLTVAQGYVNKIQKGETPIRDLGRRLLAQNSR